MFGTSRNNAPLPPPKAPPYAPPQAVRVPPARTNGRERWDGIAGRVQQRLLSELSPTVNANNVDEVRRALERIYSETLVEQDVPLSRVERGELFDQIIAGILGFGPIEPLLRDDSDHRDHDQRPAPDLRRAERQAGGDGHPLPRCGGPGAHHRPHRGAAGPAHRREQPDGRCAPARRVARQRDHPAAVAGRPVPQHPQVPAQRDGDGRSGAARRAHQGDGRVPAGVRAGADEHRHLRRHLQRQDDAAEQPVGVHPRRRAHRHHRGRRRAAAPAAAHHPAGGAAGQRGRQGSGQHPAARDQRAAHAARPHRGGRGARRRGAGHAPGHEHRPRRLADHRALERRRATRCAASRRWC